MCPADSNRTAFARRINPRRSCLIVNRHLGKHVPVQAGVAIEQAHELAATLPSSWPGRLHVIGLGETATALGAQVAGALLADSFTSTTRYAGSVGPDCVTFRENHSHAPDHVVSTRFLKLSSEADTVVVVDDEVTTGNTFLNLADALRGRGVKGEFIFAAVVDSRPQLSSSPTLPTRASRPTPKVHHVEQVESTSITWPERLERPRPSRMMCGDHRLELPTVEVPAQRRGLSLDDLLRVSQVSEQLAGTIGEHLDGRDILVIGVEEFMHLPILTAQHLGAAVQSTTRSPIFCSQVESYPVRAGWQVPSVSDPTKPAYIYNLNSEQPWVRDAVLVWPIQPGDANWRGGALRAAATVACAFDRVYVQPVLET